MPNRADERERLEAAARRANQSPFVLGLARGGLIANGLVHILIGTIAIRIVLGAKGDADQAGALTTLAETPGGVILLWASAVSLFGLAFWQLTDAAWVTAPRARTRLLRRATDAGKALGFAAVGAAALLFALGARSNSTDSSRRLSAWLFEAPGGEAVLVVIALVVASIAIAHLLRGIGLRFRDELVPLRGARRITVFALGAVGHLAKAAALLVVAALFLAAVVFDEPERATGLDAALKYVAALPSGSILLTVVAVGFIAYGLYLFARARYMRLWFG